MCFIKKIFEGKIDDSVHAQFVRFSRGTFGGRAAAGFRKTGGKVKLNFGFEYVNDIVEVLSRFGGGKCSGIVLSKENISDIMGVNKIQGNSETKRGGLFYENNINEQNLNEKQLSALISNSYLSLLDIEGDGFILKTKKKLPKPGKSDESKIDTKFCLLELPEKYWPAFKNCFFWDFPEDKKGSIMHTYVINEIIMPENEKDFEKLRVLAKRKGKIIRKISDGTERITEKAMIA